MTQAPPSSAALRVSKLPQTAATPFEVRPDREALNRIAGELDLIALRKLSFIGSVEAEGAADWRLSGRLGATVVQPCAVTLEPVTTRIDVDVTRLYQRNFVVIEAPEAEMPEDETIEPLGTWIDPFAVMREALVLNLPLYPRSEGAELGEVAVTEPGLVPLRDADLRPFAGLAALKAGLEDDPDADSD